MCPQNHPELQQCPLRNLLEMLVPGLHSRPLKLESPGVGQSVFEEALQGMALQLKSENYCSNLTIGGGGEGKRSYTDGSGCLQVFANSNLSTEGLGLQCAGAGSGLTFAPHTACHLD